MILSTQGILLHTIKHSDSSAVLQIFTKEFGRKAYFLRGLSKKKNSPRSLLFPLAILDLQVTDRDNKSLQQVRDISLARPTFELVSDPVKGCMTMFINEILHKSIEQNYQNDVLYEFLENAIQLLDVTEHVKNFHLWFLLELSKYFGFHPTRFSVATRKRISFNLEAGEFTLETDLFGPHLDVSTSRELNNILGMNFDTLSIHQMAPSARKALLNGLVNYYIIHVPNLKNVAALDVLDTVFDF
ncbi:MAG: DNA repair protein RecO [Flavobacteriales bacterium]